MGKKKVEIGNQFAVQIKIHLGLLKEQHLPVYYEFKQSVGGATDFPFNANKIFIMQSVERDYFKIYNIQNETFSCLHSQKHPS